jgi:hypothetical protein
MRASQAADGTVYVCGLVNAKNAFGGYVGDTPYFGILARISEGGTRPVFALVGMGGTDIETSVTVQMCERYGIL